MNRIKKGPTSPPNREKAEYYHIYYNSSLLEVEKGFFVEEHFWEEKKNPQRAILFYYAALLTPLLVNATLCWPGTGSKKGKGAEWRDLKKHYKNSLLRQKVELFLWLRIAYCDCLLPQGRPVDRWQQAVGNEWMNEWWFALTSASWGVTEREQAHQHSKLQTWFSAWRAVNQIIRLTGFMQEKRWRL